MTDSAAVDAFAYADRTSIARARRLPIPAALLDRLGWQPGQTLSGRATPDGFELTAAPGGTLTLADRGVIGKAQGFGLSPGGVVEFEVSGETLRFAGVDGHVHESYRQPGRDTDGVPIPPSWLAQAFTSKPNSANYLSGGAIAATMVMALAGAAGLRLTPASRVLDFGCGAGRVSRAIRKATGADIVGYDLHTAAIDWCRAHMPFGRWEYGQQTPPIGEPDAGFDLIFAISVLTHLDAHHQDLWLAEWRRLARPGGVLVVTFKSELFLAQFIAPRAADYAESVSRQLAAGGFACVSDEGWAGVFPDYYRDSFHTVDYVKSHWGRTFDIAAIHPAGTLSGSRQDVAVLRKL